jgi:hypothetical protein
MSLQEIFEIATLVLLAGIFWKVREAVDTMRAIASKTWESSAVQTNNIFDIARHLNGLVGLAGIQRERLESIQNVLSEIRDRR